MLRVRLSPGADPVLDIETSDLNELDLTFRELRRQGVWSVLKGAAREFADAPLAGVETTLAEVLPDAEVVYDGPAENAPGPVDLQQEKQTLDQWNELATERAVEAGKIERPDPTAGQKLPPCDKCGAPTTFFSGTGKNGPYDAWFCSAGGRDHTKFLKK